MSNNNQIKQLKEIINNAQYIVFFGGAGVSTESNIPDFRSATGLYQGQNLNSYRPEEILSHSFFIKHPALFYQYYFDHMVYLNALPNNAHFALTKLEEQGKLKAIITQNIDGLHQKAGSKQVYELHGSIHRNYCQKCGSLYYVEQLVKMKKPPYCHCGGIIKPDVVLYEEPLKETTIYDAIKHLSQADVLIVGGTSLSVQPASSFLHYFRGKDLVIINLEKTPFDQDATLVIHQKVGEVLKEVINKEN